MRDCQRYRWPRQRVWNHPDDAGREDEARGAPDRRGYFDLMGERAPDTDTGEPETSSDALLDELVRALAREIAERDLCGPSHQTPPHAPPRRRHEGFKMSAAAIYARYSSDLQREASIEDQNSVPGEGRLT